MEEPTAALKGQLEELRKKVEGEAATAPIPNPRKRLLYFEVSWRQAFSWG
jgi:hypothetical protein